VHWDGPKPAAVALVTIDGKLLLVERGVPPAVGFWCLPGGFVEAHESAEDAAFREVLEEAGLRVKITRLIGAYAPCHDVNEIILVYEGVVISGSVAPGDDAAKAQLFGPDELPDNIAFDQHRKVIDAWKHHVTLAPHDLDCV